MAPLFHTSRIADLGHSLWIALAFVLARGAMNRLTRGGLEAYARSQKVVGVSVGKLQEEVWLVVCGTALSAFSGLLLARSPSFDGCNLFDTSRCYSNVSSEEVPRDISTYYLIEVGWYLSLILKSVVGVGRFDSLVMEFHHFVTLALVIWSYVTGFTRIGVLTFFIFNQSNPVLHLSKFVNYMEWKQFRANLVMFLIFTAVFISSRIVLLPAVVIRCAYFGLPLAVSGKEWETTVKYTWYTTNTLLTALWLMNVYWLKPIIRVIRDTIRDSIVKDNFITPEDAKKEE